MVPQRTFTSHGGFFTKEPLPPMETFYSTKGSLGNQNMFFYGRGFQKKISGEPFWPKLFTWSTPWDFK